MMTKIEAFKILRKHGQTAKYAFTIASYFVEWNPLRFEMAYPYSAELLGVASWQ